MLDPEFAAKHLRANPRTGYHAAIEDFRHLRGPEIKKLELTESLRDWPSLPTSAMQAVGDRKSWVGMGGECGVGGLKL
jgi:hypothetical protein